MYVVTLRSQKRRRTRGQRQRVPGEHNTKIVLLRQTEIF